MSAISDAGDPDRATGESALVVVVTSVATREVADRIAGALVAENLAACVQCFPIASVYRWDGAIRSEPEYRLEAKTTRAASRALLDRLGALHPYDVPEVLVLPVLETSSSYAAWVREAVMPQ